MFGYLRIESAEDGKSFLATANNTGFCVQRTLQLSRVAIPFSDIESYTVHKRRDFDLHKIILFAALGSILGYFGMLVGAILASGRDQRVVEFILKDGRSIFGVMSDKIWNRVQAAIQEITND
jgi:hypothetical protein